MKIFNMLIIVLLTISSICAQKQFSRVKINLQETTIGQIAELGLEVDHGVFHEGRYLINDYDDQELRLLEENSIFFKVIVPDVKRKYIDQNNSQIRSESYLCNVKDFNYQTPENYRDGSMGGYLTYDELLGTLDSMQSLYPHLISSKSTIGSKLTHEGRPIFWVKIGDKPNTKEEEPEILYTALHHAREPQSLSQMIFYMWYLLENYEKDASIKGLIDNTEMYFIPCLNPDGYVHNEITDANGGGMWRKNREPADGGAKGVDLNRNYDYAWGHDEQGSSSNPNSNTYRGTGGFSEPETQAVRDFCLSHNFKIVLNYHAYGNLLIYPWGYDGSASKDDLTFKEYGSSLTSENEFNPGTSIETVGYEVNGGSDDWMYGELGIFSFTPEIGPVDYGFWPPKTEIDRLNKSALKQNIIAAQLLHQYLKVDIVPDTSQSLLLAFSKISKDSKLVDVVVRSLDPSLEFDSKSAEVQLPHLGRDSIYFPYHINQDIISKEEVSVIIEARYEYFTNSDTIIVRVKNTDLDIIYAESGESIEEWGTKEWGISESTFLSNPGSLTDSPMLDYPPFADSKITLIQEVDLEFAEKAILSFFATWEIEEDFDYAQVLISTNGETFSPLCGKFTTRGNEFQDLNQPVYEGYQPTWVKEEIDISEYAGEKVWIQFRMVSDGVEEQDGIYIDNIKVEVIEKPQSSSNENYMDASTFEIFPNPVYDLVNIKYQANSEVDIMIYDQLGRVIVEKTLPPSGASKRTLTLDFKERFSGVYYIDFIEKGEKVETIKMVKLP